MNQVGGNFWKYSNQFQKFNPKTWLVYIENSQLKTHKLTKLAHTTYT